MAVVKLRKLLGARLSIVRRSYVATGRSKNHRFGTAIFLIGMVTLVSAKRKNHRTRRGSQVGADDSRIFGDTAIMRIHVGHSQQQHCRRTRYRVSDDGDFIIVVSVLLSFHVFSSLLLCIPYHCRLLVVFLETCVVVLSE